MSHHYIKSSSLHYGGNTISFLSHSQNEVRINLQKGEFDLCERKKMIIICKGVNL